MRARARGGAGTYAALVAAVSSFSLLQSLVIPALSLISTHYEASQSATSWVLTMNLLAASIATPLVGRAGDAVGKVRMLILTLGVLAAGSLLAALAPSLGWLIVARALQGVGGGVLPLSFGIIRDTMGRRSTVALSILASLAALSFGLGMVLAGPIVEHLGYRWIFWLPLASTLLALVGALLVVPDSPVRTSGGVPFGPAFLLCLWLIALVLALSQGNAWSWGSPRVLGLFGLALVALLAWLRAEARAPVPVIDLHLMRQRAVWTANVVVLLVGFGVFAVFAFLPQMLQTSPHVGYGFGASLSESGLMLVPSSFVSFVVGFFNAPLMRRFGARAVVVTSMVLTAAAYLSLAVFHDRPWQVVAAIGVQGLGAGLAFPTLAMVIVSAVPASQTGVAAGSNANIRTIGGCLGSAVMAGIVSAWTGPDGVPLERGYTIGFALLALTAVAAAVTATMMPTSMSTHDRGPLLDAAEAGIGVLPSAPSP